MIGYCDYQTISARFIRAAVADHTASGHRIDDSMSVTGDRRREVGKSGRRPRGLGGRDVACVNEPPSRGAAGSRDRATAGRGRSGAAMARRG